MKYRPNLIRQAVLSWDRTVHGRQFCFDVELVCGHRMRWFKDRATLTPPKTVVCRSCTRLQVDGYKKPQPIGEKPVSINSNLSVQECIRDALCLKLNAVLAEIKIAVSRNKCEFALDENGDPTIVLSPRPALTNSSFSFGHLEHGLPDNEGPRPSSYKATKSAIATAKAQAETTGLPVVTAQQRSATTKLAVEETSEKPSGGFMESREVTSFSNSAGPLGSEPR